MSVCRNVIGPHLETSDVLGSRLPGVKLTLSGKSVQKVQNSWEMKWNMKLYKQMSNEY